MKVTKAETQRDGRDIGNTDDGGRSPYQANVWGGGW